MWNLFLHYELSGVLSGCEWGFVLCGFVSVGFCPYTSCYRYYRTKVFVSKSQCTLQMCNTNLLVISDSESEQNQHKTCKSPNGRQGRNQLINIHKSLLRLGSLKAHLFVCHPVCM